MNKKFLVSGFLGLTAMMAILFSFDLVSAAITISASPTSPTAIRVSWSDIPGTSMYIITRDDGINFISSSRSMTDSPLPPSTTHSYKVRSNEVPAAGESGYASATTCPLSGCSSGGPAPSSAQYTLSVSKTGGTGNVSNFGNEINCGSICSAPFSSNNVISLTVVPDTGFEFDSWSGACSGNSSICSVTMTANKSVVANFRVAGSGSITTYGGDVYGWAWSSNIGWVNFNCTQAQPSPSPGPSPKPGGCSASDYGVKMDSTGALTGYAWSSSIGWIKFGGLSGFPAGGTSGDAKVNLTTGEVTGWARACKGSLPGDCSSSTSRDDGWDGWISLSGGAGSSFPSTADGSGGVSFDPATGLFNGYAWGDEVIGWLKFQVTTPIAVRVVPQGSSAKETPPLLGCDAQSINRYMDSTTGYVLSIPKNVADVKSGGKKPFLFRWTYSGAVSGSSRGGWIESNNDKNPAALMDFTPFSDTQIYNVSVEVKDANNNENTLGCGIVRVNGTSGVIIPGIPPGATPTPPSNPGGPGTPGNTPNTTPNDIGVRLFIGKTLDTAYNTDLTVSPGEKFTLRWFIPDGVKCVRAGKYRINSANNENQVNVPEWEVFRASNADPIENDGYVLNLPSSAAQITDRNYRFKLENCRDAAGEADGYEANLHIKKSSLIEI